MALPQHVQLPAEPSPVMESPLRKQLLRLELLATKFQNLPNDMAEILAPAIDHARTKGVKHNPEKDQEIVGNDLATNIANACCSLENAFERIAEIMQSVDL